MSESKGSGAKKKLSASEELLLDKEKRILEKEGRKYGLELDRRNTIENMQKEFDEKYAELCLANDGRDPLVYEKVTRRKCVVEPTNGVKEPFAQGIQPPIQVIDGEEWFVKDFKSGQAWPGWKIQFGQEVELTSWVINALKDAKGPRPVKKTLDGGRQVTETVTRRNYSVEFVD